MTSQQNSILVRKLIFCCPCSTPKYLIHYVLHSISQLPVVMRKYSHYCPGLFFVFSLLLASSSFGFCLPPEIENSGSFLNSLFVARPHSSLQVKDMAHSLAYPCFAGFAISQPLSDFHDGYPTLHDLCDQSLEAGFVSRKQTHEVKRLCLQSSPDECERTLAKSTAKYIAKLDHSLRRSHTQNTYVPSESISYITPKEGLEA